MAVRCRLIGGSFGWSFGGLRSTGILSFSERLKCVRTACQACRRHAPAWRCFPSPFLSEFCAKTPLGGREKSPPQYTRSASLAGLSRALQTLEKRRNYRERNPPKPPTTMCQTPSLGRQCRIRHNAGEHLRSGRERNAPNPPHHDVPNSVLGPA